MHFSFLVRGSYPGNQGNQGGGVAGGGSGLIATTTIKLGACEFHFV